MCAFSCFFGVCVCLCAYIHIYLCACALSYTYCVSTRAWVLTTRRSSSEWIPYKLYYIIYCTGWPKHKSCWLYFYYCFFQFFPLIVFKRPLFLYYFSFFSSFIYICFLCTPCFFYPSADNLTIDKSCLNTLRDKLKRNMRKYILCCRMYIYSRWFYVIW